MKNATRISDDILTHAAQDAAQDAAGDTANTFANEDEIDQLQEKFRLFSDIESDNLLPGTQPFTPDFVELHPSNTKTENNKYQEYNYAQTCISGFTIRTLQRSMELPGIVMS